MPKTDRATQEEIFKQRAIAKGFSPDEIKYAIEKRRAQANIGTKLASVIANAAPAVFGTTGAIGGGMLGTIPGAALGGFAGVGAGSAVQDMLLKAAGIRTDTKEESGKRVADVTKNAAIAGGTNAALMGVGKLVGKISSAAHPIKNTGKALSEARSLTSTNPSTIETSIKSGMEGSGKYKVAAPGVKADISSGVDRYLQQFKELQSVGKGGNMQLVPKTAPSLDAYYQGLNDLKATTDPKVFKVINELVRQSIDPLQSGSAQRLSSTYGTLKTMEPYIKGAKMSLAHSAPWMLGGGYIAGQVTKSLRGNQ